jgi:hypothetical protein
MLFVRDVLVLAWRAMRRTGLAHNTIRSALRSEAPPGFRCPERPSKLDPFKEEIHEPLRGEPALPAECPINGGCGLVGLVEFFLGRLLRMR